MILRAQHPLKQAKRINPHPLATGQLNPDEGRCAKGLNHTHHACRSRNVSELPTECTLTTHHRQFVKRNAPAAVFVDAYRKWIKLQLRFPQAAWAVW